MKGEFYKMDFRAWNLGTVELTLEQEAAYLRLCHAMYDAGGPVPNSTRFLQSIFRCGNTKAVTLVNQLIGLGKIAVTSGGALVNRRVTEELADRERVSSARRAAGERGGTASGASRAKPLLDNDRGEAIASTPRSREEKIREEVEHSGGKPLRAASRKGSKPRTTISEDTQPSDRQLADAESAGLDGAEIRAQWQRFRDYHLKLDSAFADWPAAWRTWLNSPIRERERQQARASPGGPPQSPQQRALDRARQAHLELSEDRHDQDPSEADAEGHFGASRPQNGHARSDLHEPPGGRLRLAPPRLGFPPRPH
ncbi:DUF1376 domain-containing protein [Methylobacterium thuringiense]|uniref:DUF1376 domain-containing protein n=1 Tax=Methylobacterium thuringiense TaxID=1003091 RepID=UPI001EDD2D43|nr:DUF1376 domain-containing protein [Methylobacterium thuringiense]